MTSIKAKLLEPEKEYGLLVQVGGVLIGNHSKSEKSPIVTRNFAIQEVNKTNRQTEGILLHK